MESLRGIGVEIQKKIESGITKTKEWVGHKIDKLEASTKNLCNMRSKMTELIQLRKTLPAEVTAMSKVQVGEYNKLNAKMAKLEKKIETASKILEGKQKKLESKLEKLEKKGQSSEMQGLFGSNNKSIKKQKDKLQREKVKTEDKIKIISQIKDMQEKAKPREVLVEKLDTSVGEKEAGFKKMKELFGGEEKFNELPVLDIGKREGKSGYIDFIEPEEMTAPIMRGRDSHDREFFTIRAENNRGDRVCHTFFQRHPQGSSWTHVSAGSSLIGVSGYIIDGGKVYVEKYNKVKEFMQNGKNEYYTVC
jgi:hypothetical protein